MQISDIGDYLLKIQSSDININEKKFYIQQCLQYFKDVYGYLESRSDYSKEDVSEGSGHIFNAYAEGYWNVGFVADKIFWDLAGKLYKLWIIKTIEYQELNRKRVHKGMAYHQLGWIYSNYYNNNDEAYPYFLYATVEDIVSERELENLPGFQALTSIFQLSPSKIIALSKNIKELRKSDKYIPEKIISQVNKIVNIPTYEELNSVDRNSIRSLKKDWEKIKTEYDKELNSQ